MSGAAPAVDDPAAEQAPAVIGRFLTKRTLLSILAAVIIVAVVVWRADIPWGEAWAKIRAANLLFYLLAIAVYYLSFVARGIRWQVLLANAGEVARPAGSPPSCWPRSSSTASSRPRWVTSIAPTWGASGSASPAARRWGRW